MRKNVVIDVTTIGGRIKALRIRNGLSQEELAEKLFIDPKYLSHYECNRRDLSGDMLLLMAKTLHSSPDYIMNGTEEEAPDTDIMQAMEILNHLKTAKARKAALEHLKIVAMMEDME